MDKINNYLKWDIVHRVLLERNLRIFSLLDFIKLFQISKQSAISFLARHSRRGNLSRLKRGLYTLSLHPPSLYLVANSLYQPSYISFETALSIHGLIPEVVYAYTSATPKVTQRFIALGNEFVYHSIKKKAFTGYVPTKLEGETILLATAEKAVIDYLYFVSLGKKEWIDRLQTRTLRKEKLREYAQLFDRRQLFNLLSL